ncbi:hypothetical protein H181DRAFT_00924 [Streptomyces sp. WMMB 714]|uniref:hypothetical protein n=1 Tax=Streptomyces sp. WMMB 714 TaxID=1286822 RepID=UPI000823B1DD|nr:hypothetical protein [Streptomyces sp. WMMB 714]SCK14323.1 hypothetical protein H181DRAFT_00924 [Streptomyces sp. WMMB 714]
MPTALAVTSDGHMLPPPDRQTPRAHVFRPPGDQPLELALAETQRLVNQHGHLVVVYPATLDKPFVHRLHTIRSVLESDRIALLPTRLPPLGTAVLVRQLRQLSLCDFSPGVLAAAARLLAHYVYAGALLNSVAKLDHVSVPLTAHAKSWMSRSQFAVLAAPGTQLVRLDANGAAGGGGSEASLAGPQFPTHLTVARGALNSEWVNGTLAAQWNVRGVQEAQLPGESARWWGTGKLIEFAAAIPDVSVLYQLVSSVRRDECHWCGLELIGDRCAFCAAPASYGPAPASRRAPGPQVATRQDATARPAAAGRGGSGLGGYRRASAGPPAAPHTRHAVVADPRGL